MHPNFILDSFLRFLYETDVLAQLEINPLAFTISDIKDNYNRLMFDAYMDDDSKGPMLTDIEIKEVLEKLTKDEFLIRTTYDIYPDTFATTFEGKWFIRQGGYTRKLFKEKITSIFQLSSAIAISSGALVATIYYLHELLKGYHVSFVSGMTLFYMALTINLTILVLWLIVQEIRTPRR